ncbi:TPA: FimV/HubP family polar landmark protein [Aeromonas veronii]
MTIVTPTTQGDVLLENGTGTHSLQDVVLIDVFSLEVRVECSLLEEGGTLYWVSPGHPPIESVIPSQVCEQKQSAPILPPVRIIDLGGRCVVDTGGNTLWRVASELAAVNQFSIQQNVYALFLVNRNSFVGEDIHRLKVRTLACPSSETFKKISTAHARRLFAESVRTRQ